MEAGTGLKVTGDDRDMKTETSIISQAQVAALTGRIYTSTSGKITMVLHNIHYRTAH